MRALGDGATLRIDAALIKFQQLVTQVVVSGQESSFGQSDGCILTTLLGEIRVGDLVVHAGI